MPRGILKAYRNVTKELPPFQRCLAVDDGSPDGRGLWFLAQHLDGYELGRDNGGLCETFHRPMLREWDRVDLTRAQTGEQIDTLDLWPRDHYKTWCLRMRMIRYYMRCPWGTVTWWHAVEEMAQESAEAVGKLMQFGKAFRALCRNSPLELPPITRKKWVSASGFKLAANRTGDAPSMRAAGAGTEVTGGHSEIGVLDDIVGLNDVNDNQMANKMTWYKGTVRNVVRSHGWINCIGTRWSLDDPYGKFKNMPGWKFTHRACLETNGVPDYDGQPVFLTMAQVQRKRGELGEMMFALQMMNDAMPKSEIPWKATRQSVFIPYQSDDPDDITADGPGIVWVLSDPAPRVIGGAKGDGEKQRGDGTKDDWATAAVKLKNYNGLIVAVLMEMTFSTEWDTGPGFDECCRLMHRWHTNKFVPEFVNLDWTSEAKRASKRNGVPLYLNEKGALPRFEVHYGAAAKNTRFGILCDWSQVGRFYICDTTVSDEAKDKLWHQLTKWRPLPKGRNTLPHDDLADIASRCTDPLLARWTPPLLQKRSAKDWSPYRAPEQEPDPEYKGRYISF